MDRYQARMAYCVVLKRVRNENPDKPIDNQAMWESRLHDKAREYLIELERKHKEFIDLMEWERLWIKELEESLCGSNKIEWFANMSNNVDQSDK